MQISLQKALSFYLTGRTTLPEAVLNSETTVTQLTKQELDDMEISSPDEYARSESESFHFSEPALNLRADFNTVHGQFRMAGLGVINSFFSGIGTGLGSKLNFLSGLGLAALSLGASFLKKVPFLSTKFSIMGFGGNLIRGPLHIFDSIFSTIGEHGSKGAIPSILASGVSAFSLAKTVLDKDNKDKEPTLPFDTVAGTLGRTAIHHIDSMLASKAAQISNSSHAVGSFLAGSLTTAGLLAPDSIKKKNLPWNTHEGFIAQGGSNFLDSLSSNIGNSFSCLLNNSRNVAIAAGGIVIGMPILGTLLNSINYQIPFGTLEGRLVRGIFHAPESLVFNAGTILGNSALGIPLSLGFGGLTYLTCVSEQGKKLLKNVDISRDKIGGLIQRLPFHLIYSMVSATGVKLSKFIPAPLLALAGPALSFQMGELFKNIDAKYDDLKGLMLRNSVHLWETVLARAAYRTGRMLTGTQNEETSSGSILSDGRWLSDDGQILPSMAIGKQTHNSSDNNLTSIVLSALGGIGFAFGSYFLGRYLIGNKNSEPLDKEISQAAAIEVAEKSKPLPEAETHHLPSVRIYETAA